MQEKGQVSIFKLTLTLITASFISGDVMCLHQLENHEPVEFGELGIDPVERDQVTSFMSIHMDIPSLDFCQEIVITSTVGQSIYLIQTGIFPS